MAVVDVRRNLGDMAHDANVVPGGVAELRQCGVALARLTSTEAAGDVVLGLLLGRLRKNGFGAVMLDQIAQVHEGGVVGHARGLLHVVGDDHDGVVALELFHQLFDPAGGNRVQRGRRFVQQQHIRAQRYRTCDAQALLLATGKTQRALPQLVLDLVPQRALAQGLLDAVLHVGFGQFFVVADAVGHVFEDGHRKRHRLLEHHAHLAAQAVHRVLRRQDVFVVQQYLAARFHLRIQRVDAVEDAQQGRLAAAGGTDQRSDALFGDLDVDALERVVLVVIEIQIACGHLHRRLRRRRPRGGRDSDAMHRLGVLEIVHVGCPEGKVSHWRSCCARAGRARPG
ncbi:hypothetical protein XAC2852_300002 [Xanthomonas citri pv. citri]|nr:hypothetical protein XAC2852_300002 [Xanthomonas citri pv. citri]